MILINGQWEEVKNLYDIQRIIREQFSTELADIMDTLVFDYDMNEEVRLDYDKLQDDYDMLDCECDDLQSCYDALEEEVEELRKLKNSIKELIMC